MNRRSPRNIVVTGASGGLGRALIREYAHDRAAFLLFGRDVNRLCAAGETARSAGATVVEVPCEAQDRETAARELRNFDASHPVDLVLHLIGTKCGNEQGVEPGDAFDTVIQTNLAFPAFVDRTLLPEMCRRGRGRIAFLSSLAAVVPQPDLISYSASKAGLSAYGIALRRALRGTGVGVTVVTAGFIDTPMTAIHDGPTPIKFSAGTAARIIRTGLDRECPHIRFPRRLWMASHICNMLPASLSDRIAGRMRATILDEDARRHAASSDDKTSISRSS